MPTRTPTDWWNRFTEPTFFSDDVSSAPLNYRLLMCAMFERAWNDLAVTPDIKPDHRRSALKWFKGVHADKVPLNFYAFCQVVGMTESRKKALENRMRVAERCLPVEEEVELDTAA